MGCIPDSRETTQQPASHISPRPPPQTTPGQPSPERAAARLKPVRNFTVKRSRETLDDTHHAVFRVAELPRAMSDDDLAHTKSAGRRQHRHEAVQFTVQPHLAEHLPSIALHAAIVVVQLTPVSTLTSQLNTREGSTLCQGS